MIHRFILLLLLTASSAGCGASLGRVSGLVTVNGEPKENLVVSFTPTGGGVSASAVTGKDGSYLVTSTLGSGIPPGNYSVKISTLKSALNDDASYTQETQETQATDSYAQRAESAMEGQQKQYGDGLKAYRGAKDPIPAKYNSDSTLLEEIEAGSQTIDFNLEI
ncbi:carboxypeptidase-like regulatory domain-containing protein [Aureliella helgolandensis]|uniref:Carboxypeptidase regulatory-like domain-containing protein n=1 Tax=Aureliella helgolandensis TaxID=2527968 RepID=A0A518G1N1_9BACT|nr:carboxypeptidase-like regulatory domain-containing protein [Aureliella helgolandensis]QDV22511.1 hypothetical protein Q31a_07970 [Aureliella helgolandensis]